MTGGLILMQLLNGAVLGMVYILIAIGLTIVFGMLNIVNFAHGAVFALGAYVAFTFVTLMGAWSGNFWVTLLITPVIVGLIGAFIEIVLLRRMYETLQDYQILLTFGIMLVLQELIFIIWGPIGKSVPMPAHMNAVITIGIYSFPIYFIFLIVFGSILCLSVWLFIERTNYGAIIRAGTDNRNMVNCLGIDIYKVFTLVFSLGVGLAGLAGALALPMRGVHPFMGYSVLIVSFVVVVIGGMGSLAGAILGGLIVGIVESMMALIWPKGTMISIFAAMALVIFLRPKGLVGIK